MPTKSADARALEAMTQAAATRLYARNSARVVNPPPSLEYSPAEEKLLAILRYHAEHDPLFGELWRSGRASPANIVTVLVAYGVSHQE